MRDQKRWMKNWIRALAVGTMITAAVPISVMAAEKGWVNEDGAAHYVDSNGSYVKISGKLPREFPIIWMKTEIWRRMYGLTVLTMPEKMAV